MRDTRPLCSGKSIEIQDNSLVRFAFKLFAQPSRKWIEWPVSGIFLAAFNEVPYCTWGRGNVCEIQSSERRRQCYRAVCMMRRRQSLVLSDLRRVQLGASCKTRALSGLRPLVSHAPTEPVILYARELVPSHYDCSSLHSHRLQQASERVSVVVVNSTGVQASSMPPIVCQRM